MTRELTFDEAEELGFDGTLRNGHPPYTLHDVHPDILKRWPDLAHAEDDRTWTELKWLISVGIPSDHAVAIIADPRYVWHTGQRVSNHTVRGLPPGPEGWPYGTTHDMDCPGCAGTSFTASPRSETYWSS